MTRLMVIGGSGFFGKSILDAYRRGIFSPWAINSLTLMARNASSLKNTHPHLLDESITLVDEDISTCQYLPNADFVIHAAASTDASNYISKPLQEKNNILLAVLNYCRLAQEFHRNSKIIYCSSGAVYGHQPSIINQLSESADFGDVEEMSLGKRDYASAKRDAETQFLRLGLAGLDVSIARCFSFIGPHLPLDQHFAIGNFIWNGLQNESIIVNAKSAVYRSYLHADDLVQWLMKIGQVASNKCPIFNVGSDEVISIQDLSIKIAAYFQVNLQLPLIENALVDRYVPSIEKAQKIGCRVELKLDQAIEKTVASLRDMGHSFASKRM